MCITLLTIYIINIKDGGYKKIVNLSLAPLCGEMDYKAYKRTPKWELAELASDPNLATPHYTSCLLMLDPARVCQGQRNVDNKVDFLLICLSDESIFIM